MTAPTDIEADASQLTARRWQLRPPPDLAAFAAAPWPRIISVLLAHRGVRSEIDGYSFLSRRPGDLTDAALMPNLDVAAGRLLRACAEGETVAVFGDYDVDGVTATTVLTEGLRCLGAHPLPYLPHRFTEGYGPNPQAIRYLHQQGATLLVTADTGTSAVDEVALANELGMEVIVVDHHTIPDVLPEALAIVNPRLVGDAYGSGYGSEPAAVGVAYKLVHDLHDRLGRPYNPAEHRALVALGTVCDVAPLVAENRDLVRLGLAALRETQRPGLRALAAKAGVNLAEADTTTCGWTLGPRLNAAGRMAHARLALDLLLAPDEATAEPLAEELESLNRERRAATEAAIEAAQAGVADQARAARGDAALVFVASAAISSGIVGLVAARLADAYRRPAIVMEIDGSEARASCRSIPGFDVTALLRRHADLFVRYGGHRAAAGFTLDTRRIEEARERLTADAAAHLQPADMEPVFEIDAELPLNLITPNLLKWFGRLGPYGEGNPAPAFLASGVEVLQARTVGRDGAHLQFTVRQDGVNWRAISFGNADRAVPPGDRADIIYQFRKDDWSGSVQLEVIDLRPSAPSAR